MMREIFGEAGSAGLVTEGEKEEIKTDFRVAGFLAGPPLRWTRREPQAASTK